ncbi:unnamed protein product [marine sediment metagenome]|uniref:Uncharacterized protein n=1 Tax=marine sediment metagenome TaxID=412755 RepID=X1V4N6_9ZZZZ
MPKEENFRSETVKEIAKVLAIAARTAPKARGIDNLLISLVEGNEKMQLVEKMQEIAASGYKQINMFWY